jgi:hypothetical protein
MILCRFNEAKDLLNEMKSIYSKDKVKFKRFVLDIKLIEGAILIEE